MFILFLIAFIQHSKFDTWPILVSALIERSQIPANDEIVSVPTGNERSQLPANDEIGCAPINPASGYNRGNVFNENNSCQTQEVNDIINILHENGVITYAYQLPQHKAAPIFHTISNEAQKLNETQFVAFDFVKEGFSYDLLVGIRLIWTWITDNQNTHYIVNIPVSEEATESGETIRVTVTRQFFTQSLNEYLINLILIATLIIGLNAVFVFGLVRYLVSNPIQTFTIRIKSLVGHKLTVEELNHKEHQNNTSKVFQFSEIQSALSALQIAEEHLVPRDILEDRSEGVMHEINHDALLLEKIIKKYPIDDDTQKRALAQTNRLSSRLTDIIKFVTWSREKLNRKDVCIEDEINSACDDAIKIIPVLAPNKPENWIVIDSKVFNDLRIMADPDCLRIILDNLLRNSICAFNYRESLPVIFNSIKTEMEQEFSKGRSKNDPADLNQIKVVFEPESQFRIKISCDKKADEIVICVVDNANGIDKTLRSNVFEKGVSSNQKAGHGYGLLWVCMLVEAHGGSIRLVHTRHREDIKDEMSESIQKKNNLYIKDCGSEFEIRFPIQQNSIDTKSSHKKHSNR